MKRFITNLPVSEQERIDATAREVLPRVLPSGWRVLEPYSNACWYLRYDDLRVCCEVEWNDGELWLHISVSKPRELPKYRDLTAVKEIFAGSKRKAIQVLPSADEHYNDHPYCLHLFVPLTRDPLPDFRIEGGGL